MKHQTTHWSIAAAQGHTSRQSVSGVALTVCLILLVAVTLIGVSTLSGTRLNEQIVSNSQQKTIAFEAAQSGIESVWEAEYLRSQVSSMSTNVTDEPVAIDQPSAVTGLESAYDLTTDAGGVDLNGELTIQYCGEAEVIGGSINADESVATLVSMIVDVTSNSNIENTHTKALIVQRAAITSTKTGRAGSCVSY